MRDDDERVFPLQLVHQVLDRLGRDRVECRRGLVEQHDVRLDRDRARDAEALLLPAREAERRTLQAVLDLVPDRRAAERLLDPVVEVVLHPEDPQAVGDVVVDRLREGVRPLEDHADPPPHLDRVDVASVDVGAVVEQVALDPGARHEVVHPVQTAEEGRLAAAGGADQRRDRRACRSRARRLRRRALSRTRPRGRRMSKTACLEIDAAEASTSLRAPVVRASRRRYRRRAHPSGAAPRRSPCRVSPARRPPRVHMM